MRWCNLTHVLCLSFSSRSSDTKDANNSQKLSRGGIPLANGDAFLPKPPPWAYPLTGQDMQHGGYERMSRSASQAIDQAMAQLWEAKAKFVRVSLSVEKQQLSNSNKVDLHNSNCGTHCCDLQSDSSREGSCHASRPEDGSDFERVRVLLTADPGVSMDDIEDQEPPRRKEHRRVPSTVAFEEVKVSF